MTAPRSHTDMTSEEIAAVIAAVDAAASLRREREILAIIDAEIILRRGVKVRILNKLKRKIEGEG
jgi:hypothetical protein